MPQEEIKPPEFSFQWIFIDFILLGLFGLWLLFILSRFTFLHWSRYGIHYLTPYFPGGNINDFLFGEKSFANVFQELYEHGKELKQKVCGIYLLTRPGVVINEPELIKTVLETDFESFQDRGMYYQGIHDPFAAFTSQTSGSKWNTHLDLTSIFSEDFLQNILNDLRECVQTSCKNLPPASVDTDAVNVNTFVLDLMVPILGKTTFGLKSDKTIDEEIKKLYNVPMSKYAIIKNFVIGVYPELLIFSKFMKTDILDLSFVNNNRSLKLNKHFEKIWEKIQLYEDKSIKHYDSHSENCLKAFKFLFNCLELLNPLIVFTLYELARNLDIQDKLRKEINKVVYKIEDFNYQNLSKKFPYLDMVLKESLRKYPVNPSINRICIKDYKVENSKQVISKGALIFIPVFSIHNDSKYYQNPDIFDPERFANDKSIKEYTYLPFGDGKRTCIGKTFGLITVKLALIMILKQYQLNECSVTPTTIQFKPNVYILTTNQDIWLKFSKI